MNALQSKIKSEIEFVEKELRELDELEERALVALTLRPKPFPKGTN